MPTDIPVVVSIVSRRGRFLLIRRRHAEGSLRWQFPGGKQERGESLAKAAERETLEETGVVCRAIHEIGSRLHPQTKVMISYWLCRYEGSDTPLSIPSDEVGDARWISGPEALRTLTSDLYEPIRKYLLDPEITEQKS